MVYIYEIVSIPAFPPLTLNLCLPAQVCYFFVTLNTITSGILVMPRISDVVEIQFHVTLK